MSETATETAALRIEDAVNETCPWSGKPIAADSLTLYRGFVVGFCNTGCRDKFEAATRHFEAALAGSACGRIGQVISRGILRVDGLGGKRIIETDLAALKAAWLKPLTF